MVLSINIYLIVAIIIIMLLVLAYFAFYVINQKTALPPGCEEIARSAKMCSACNNKTCQYNESKQETMEEK